MPAVTPTLIPAVRPPGALHQPTRICAVATDPTGRYVVTVDDKGAVRWFDRTAGTVLTRRAPARIRSRDVRDVAVSPDASLVLVRYSRVSWLLRTAVFETGDGVTVPYISTTALHIAPDGGEAVVGEGFDTTRLVDADTGAQRLCPAAAAPGWASAGPPAAAVRAVAEGTEVALFDAASGARLTPESPLPGGADAIAFEAGGEALWTGDGAAVRRWRLPAGTLDRVVPAHGHVRALTPDGRWGLVAYGERPDVLTLRTGSRVLDLATGEIGPPAGDSHRIPALSRDGGRHATVGPGGEHVVVHDTRTGARLQTLEGLRGYPYAIAFAPGGHLLAAGDGHGDLVIWDLRTGAAVRKFRLPRKPAIALAWAPDEGSLAVGGDERAVRIVGAGGEERFVLTGHTRRAVWTVAYSPDGALLASSDEHDTRLWHTADGTPAGTVRAPAGALAFSADSRRLAGTAPAAAWIVDVATL